jgi:1-acyl-sn-glycerol-3-phosphate acyltransferase
MVCEVSMLFYRAMRRISWALLKVFFRMKVTGREHVPKKGPLVVVANHDSFLDPFVVGTSLMKRHVTFLAAPWLLSSRVTNWFVQRVGALQAYGDGSEVSSLRGSIRLLQKGGTVGLFPQGGIGRDEIFGGAVFMALKGRAPILPMRINGAGEALPLNRRWPSLFTKITVDIRAPMLPAEIRPPGVSNSDAVDGGVKLLAQVLMLEPAVDSTEA